MNSKCLAGVGPALPPPSGLLNRWRFYRSRYGTLHAAARYLGTRAKPIWPIVGPLVTRRQLLHWRSNAKLRVVNLGGGGNCLSGCLTADIDPRADVYVDLMQSLPFEQDEIHHIFCEEAIEHIPKSAALRLLRECHRVLEPNGTLRLTTPDLDWMIGALSAGDMDCDAFNDCFYDHGHRYLYSRTELVALLTEVGFSMVRVSTYQDLYSPLGHLDSHADRFRHPPELSQYQEATK